MIHHEVHVVSCHVMLRHVPSCLVLPCSRCLVLHRVVLGRVESQCAVFWSVLLCYLLCNSNETDKPIYTPLCKQCYPNAFRIQHAKPKLIMQDVAE